MESLDIIHKNKEIIKRIKDYLDVVNYDFLVDHMSVIRSLHHQSRRDSEDNYFYTYSIEYDSYGQQLLADRSNDFKCVINTHLYDTYLTSLEEVILNPSWKSTEEYKNELKIKICNSYNRYNHISTLIGQYCLPNVWGKDITTEERKQIESSLIQDLKLLDYQIDSISEFKYQLDEYSIICEIEQFGKIKLKSLNGVWGNRVFYYNNEKCVSQEKSIDIPFSVKWMGIDWDIIDIADGFFNNCKELETVVLPDNLKSFCWSFWNCPKLKEIRTKNNNTDTDSFPKIVSYKGVLYRIHNHFEECELLAYPNMYASDFHIPETIEVAHRRITVSGISKYGFKCCDKLESLHIPRNVKHIGINAFYRCNNLRFIYYYGKPDNIKIEGFAGEYGYVNPVWLCEATLLEMQPKIELSYSEEDNNMGTFVFIIGGVKFKMIRVPSKHEVYSFGGDKAVMHSYDTFFFLGETAVTRSLWKTVMKDFPKGQTDEDRPILVNYLQAKCFIKALVELTNISFRLPTTGIWYSAAAGEEKKINYHNCINKHEKYHVKSIKTNDWGFYDMIGQGELCENTGVNDNNRVPIMGGNLQDVRIDSGEYAFRLYIDYDESKRLLQSANSTYKNNSDIDFQI